MHAMNQPVYEEVIEFIAAGATPQQVVDFRPSELLQERVKSLVVRHRAGELSVAEQEELNQYLMLEHVMRLAKARARKHLRS